MASYHCTIIDALEVTYIYCVCVIEILGKGVSSASRATPRSLTSRW